MVATLRVLHDASASDALARLLTGPRWRIGPRDLVALGRRARDLARGLDTVPEGIPDVGPAGADRGANARCARSRQRAVPGSDAVAGSVAVPGTVPAGSDAVRQWLGIRRRRSSLAGPLGRRRVRPRRGAARRRQLPGLCLPRGSTPRSPAGHPGEGSADAPTPSRRR